MTIKIIYEDDFVIICHKKAKIAVETSKLGEMDLVSQLRNYRVQKNEESYIGMVHRLDQPVEGVLVFAKNQAVAASLSKQISQGQIKKTYLAIISTKPVKEQDILVDYLLKNGKTNTSSVVDKSVKQAKKSELHYQIIDTKEELSLVEIELMTGRHHQIRVQMAHAKMPLWGDVKYNKEFVNQRGTWLALCAYKLSFLHPISKKQLSFQIQPENEMFTQFDWVDVG